jgi:L,D-transpeptidase YcbB
MRSLSAKHLLMTTALTLLASSGAALADPDVPLGYDPIAAAIPLPEPANLPPPPAADIGLPVTGTVTPAASSEDGIPAFTAVETPVISIDELVPMPETANVPPPTAKDIGALPVDPVTEKLAQIVPSRLDRLVDRKPDRAAVAAFYKERAYAPLWMEKGAVTERAKAAAARIKAADADGLDPDDYAIPALAGLDSPQALAEADVKLTVAALAYARNAQSGRVHPWRVSANIEYPLPVPESPAVLAALAGSKDIAKTLDAFNPPHPGFQALRKKLAELRGHGEEAPSVRIPPGPTLKVGKKDARVPLLRERLAVDGDPANTTYDKPLHEALMAFQRGHGLTATGTLNPATMDALNGTRSGREVDAILANMERWRWLPRDLGKVHVMVNIPDFTLRVVRDNGLVWQTRIVVGKPHLPTPLLTADMKFITVNPTWNVPPSIVQNEYLPALRNDPDAMRRIGLQVTYNRDGTVHISQPPGDRNALGRIRFNFPNKFLVYQHDTPDKQLFNHDKRAYSHGCMRVQDPLKYAEVLLGITHPKDGYTQDRIRKMFGSSEVDIKFPSFIPVHLTYQTAFVDENGKLQMREDVYGLDARLAQQFRGDHRVAETSPGAPPRQAHAPARLGPGEPRYGGRQQAMDGPFWFFGRMFQ